MKQDIMIKLIITIGALIILIVRFILPDLLFDTITLGILVIAILPWVSSFVEKLKAGDLEIEFKNRLEKVEDKVEKVIDTSSEEGEPILDPTEIVATLEATADIDAGRVELTDNEQSVLRALTKANVPLRSQSGISKDTQLNVTEIARSLDVLVDKGLAAEVQGKKGIRWGITPGGRNR